MSYSLVIVPARSKPYKLDIEKDEFTLDLMHRLVDGYIEVVNVSHIPGLPKMLYTNDLRLVVDDEGMYKEPCIFNKVASFIYGGQIVGNTFICIQGFDSDTCEHDIFPLSTQLATDICKALSDLYLKLYSFEGRFPL